MEMININSLFPQQYWTPSNVLIVSPLKSTDDMPPQYWTFFRALNGIAHTIDDNLNITS